MTDLPIKSAALLSVTFVVTIIVRTVSIYVDGYNHLGSRTLRNDQLAGEILSASMLQVNSG